MHKVNEEHWRIKAKYFMFYQLAVKRGKDSFGH
jgi:hypothetical protein